MAMVKNAVALLIVMALFEAIDATVHKVGNSAGWTTIGNIDYKQWAANNSFHVGDIIVFQYNSRFHNVMRVTHTMYKACNATTPLATYTSGNDSITIKTRGHHYFFCGVPGHCQAGQKVDINVPRLDQQLPLTPSASPSSAPPSAPVPAARVSGPSPNSALSFSPSKSFLALAFLGVFGINFA